MRSAILGVGFVFVLSLPACGSPPPPVAPPPAPPPPPVATVAAPAEPDLSPVAEPKNLIGVGRWRSVAGTLSAVEKLARLPVPLQSLVEKEVGDKEVLDALKLDSAVEIAAVLDPAEREPDVLFAFSLPLKSLDQAKGIAEREGKATMVRPGVYRLGRTRNVKDVTCAIAVSLGDAPARLVCGQRDRDLDALLPYMTRGLPTTAMGTSDIHIDVRFAPLQEKLKPLVEQNGQRLPAMAALMLSRETGISDPVVLDMVGSVADEAVKLGQELDGLTLDATLDGGAATGDFKGTLRFLGAKSWMTKALTSRADKQGPAPDLFWQAPKDADTAFYGRGGDPKLFEPIPKAIAALVGALAKEKLPDADRQAIQDLLARIPINDAVTVSARGHIDVSPPAASAKPTPAMAIKAAHDKVTTVLGWTVVGYDTKADATTAWLKDLVRVYNRPSLQTFMKTQLRKEARLLPVIRTISVPGLPGGSFAIEAGVNLESKDVWDLLPRQDGAFVPHPAGAPARGFVGVTMVVVPDGANRSWVGFGGDAAVLKDKIKSSLSTGAKDGTLATRPGLEALRSGSTLSGGFLSIAGTTHSLLDLAKGRASRREAKMAAAVVEGMPNHGSTPILLTTSATAGSTPTSGFEVRVQKGTFDDLAAAVLVGIAQRSRADEPSMGVPAPMPPPPPPPSAPKKK